MAYTSIILAFTLFVQQIKSDLKQTTLKLNNAVNFEDAEAKCNLAGQDIASVLSSEDNLIAEELYTNNTCDGMYISKCISVYTNWEATQPDNWGFKEYCIAILGDYTYLEEKFWFDIPCTWKSKCVLCQKPDQTAEQVCNNLKHEGLTVTNIFEIWGWLNGQSFTLSVVLFIIYAAIEKDLKNKVYYCNLILLIFNLAWIVLSLALMQYFLAFIGRLIVEFCMIVGAFVNIRKLDNGRSLCWIWLAVWSILMSLGWLSALVMTAMAGFDFQMIVLTDASYIVMTVFIFYYHIKYRKHCLKAITNTDLQK